METKFLPNGETWHIMDDIHTRNNDSVLADTKCGLFIRTEIVGEWPMFMDQICGNCERVVQSGSDL